MPLYRSSYRINVSGAFSPHVTKYPLSEDADFGRTYVDFKASEDFCSAHVHIRSTDASMKSKKFTGNEVVRVRFHTMSGSVDKTTEPKSLSFGNGYNGFNKLIETSICKQDPEIYVDVEIIDDSAKYFYDSRESNALQSNQQKTLYDLGKLFGEISLIAEEKQSDSDGDGVRVSRILLMSASNVFKKMLTVKMKESTEKTVSIPCKLLQTIDDMVYFIATGILRKDALAFKLLELSHCYELKALNCACMDRLVTTVTPKLMVLTVRAFERFSFGDEINKKIYFRLISYYRKNKKTFAKDVNFDEKQIPLCFTACGDYMKL